MNEATFNVRSVAATSSLSTRETAKNLFCHIRQTAELQIAILDFSSIEFVSRSFADQLLKEQASLFNSNNVIVKLQNLNSDVVLLLDKVLETLKKTKVEHYAMPVLNFTDHESLTDFLISI